MRQKALGENSVRVTVRLPHDVHHALLSQRYRHLIGGGLSDIIRHALTHYLDCPALHQAEEEAKAATAAKRAATQAQIAQEMEAKRQENWAKQATRLAQRQAECQDPPPSSPLPRPLTRS